MCLPSFYQLSVAAPAFRRFPQPSVASPSLPSLPQPSVAAPAFRRCPSLACIEHCYKFYFPNIVYTLMIDFNTNTCDTHEQHRTQGQNWIAWRMSVQLTAVGWWVAKLSNFSLQSTHTLTDSSNAAGADEKNTNGIKLTITTNNYCLLQFYSYI